ncbi:MAG: hypothetical protein ABSD53_12515 [Terriglobales bacterium]
MSTNGQNASRAAEEMAERLLKRWPNHKKDTDQVVMYRDDIRALIAECGEGRVRAAEESAHTHCNFLPEPAELRELLPSPNFNNQFHDPSCRDCSGSGWKMIDDKYAVRCACVPSLPGAPEPDRAQASDLRTLHAVLKQGVDQSLVVNKILPAPDPNRRVALKEQAARMQEQRAKRAADPSTSPATLRAPIGGVPPSCRKPRARR